MVADDRVVFDKVLNDEEVTCIATGIDPRKRGW